MVLDVVVQIWGTLLAILTMLGFVFTIFDLFQFRTEILGWWKKRKEFAASARALASTNHFIVDVIQVGGEFSMIHSLAVRVASEGDWYLNPPNRFVWIGWNRGGDLMLVTQSEFTQRHGKFAVESYKDAAGVVTLVDSESCALPITAMKNRYEVRFVRVT